MSIPWHLRAELRYFLLAVQAFTRMPVPSWVNGAFDEMLFSNSARYLPLVGLLVGVVAAVVYVPASWLLPPIAAALLSLAAALWITSAVHESGLTATLDASAALPGAAKDLRLGAFGAASLIIVIALKASALADMPIEVGAVSLIAAHALSRAYGVALILMLPNAHATTTLLLASSGSGTQPAQPVRVSTGSTIVAALLGMLPWFAVVLYDGLAVQWLLAVMFSAAACVACGMWFWRRLGGMDSHAMGAAQQITELAFYLGVAMKFD
jgi:adenosylcobinamide-GDP ribazoletransferase